MRPLDISLWCLGLVFIVMGAIPAYAQTAQNGPTAQADPAEQTTLQKTGAEMVAEFDGQQISLPLLDSHYDVSIVGNLARVSVSQVFENPTGTPLNAQYLFPLNQHAAISAMTMIVGDERIDAVIQEKQQAQETFEAAKAEGKAASLLVQHRPNMFTQNVANLMPGLPVRVWVEYAQEINKVDGAYEFVVPLVVGPRFGQPGISTPIPASSPQPSTEISTENSEGGGWQADGREDDALPVYPASVVGVTTNNSALAGERVSLDLTLGGGLEVQSYSSATHDLMWQVNDAGVLQAKFLAGKVRDDRDFVLRYRLEGTQTAASAVAYLGEDLSGTVQLMIEPPANVPENQAVARDLIFVIDISGSQSGLPLEASKTMVRTMLDNLRPTDHFRILTFEDAVTVMSNQTLAATPRNIAKAKRWVAGLSTLGGTNIFAAIEEALSLPQPENTTRTLVFLSDGFVGNESQVLSAVQRRLGDARIFALGVGAGVNRYLIDGIARLGKGYARYVDPTDTTHETAKAMAHALRTPVLTDITVDWGALAVQGTAPKLIPDLYAGDSVAVLARVDSLNVDTVRISGLAGNQRVSLPVTISRPESQDLSALPTIWAKKTVADLTLDYQLSGQVDVAAKQAATALALDYGLQSDFTSFVAVSSKIVNQAPEQGVDASVALNQVAGTSADAYGKMGAGAGAAPTALVGSSTPEPGALIALIVALFAVALRFWRRIRQAIVGVLVGAGPDHA